MLSILVNCKREEAMVCTANLGVTHSPKVEEADRTIVCVSGFDRP